MCIKVRHIGDGQWFILEDLFAGSIVAFGNTCEYLVRRGAGHHFGRVIVPQQSVLAAVAGGGKCVRKERQWAAIDADCGLFWGIGKLGDELAILRFEGHPISGEGMRACGDKREKCEAGKELGVHRNLLTGRETCRGEDNRQRGITPLRQEGTFQCVGDVNGLGEIGSKTRRPNRPQESAQSRRRLRRAT
jgi:hypothetical protein